MFDFTNIQREISKLNMRLDRIIGLLEKLVVAQQKEEKVCKCYNTTTSWDLLLEERLEERV